MSSTRMSKEPKESQRVHFAQEFVEIPSNRNVMGNSQGFTCQNRTVDARVGPMGAQEYQVKFQTEYHHITRKLW
jgi:hypothetical protein